MYLLPDLKWSGCNGARRRIPNIRNSNPTKGISRVIKKNNVPIVKTHDLQEPKKVVFIFICL